MSDEKKYILPGGDFSDVAKSISGFRLQDIFFSQKMLAWNNVNMLINLQPTVS